MNLYELTYYQIKWKGSPFIMKIVAPSLEAAFSHFRKTHTGDNWIIKSIQAVDGGIEVYDGLW